MSEYLYIMDTDFKRIGFKYDGNRSFSKEIDGEALILHVTDEKTHYELSLLDTDEFKIVVLPAKPTDLDQLQEVLDELTPVKAWALHIKIRATFENP